MKTRFSLVLAGACAFAAGSARAGLDFTLQHKATQADAIAVDKPYITDGPSKIYLQYLGNWQLRDSADALEFTPNVPGSQVRIGLYKGSELKIDEAGARALFQQMSERLPKGAAKVTALPVEYNPFPIFGWTDMQVSVRYEFYGQAMRQSTMYVHMLPGRLVEFSVTALDADFAKVYKPGRAILASWFEPSRDLPPELAHKYEDQGAPK